MPLTVKNAKIALLDMNLAKFRLPAGVSVVVQNPDNLENIRQRELDLTKERCKKKYRFWCKCNYLFKGNWWFCFKIFCWSKIYCSKKMWKIWYEKISCSNWCKNYGNFRWEEIFNKDCLGKAEEVSEEAVNDYNYVFFKKSKKQSAQTILLRGANYLMLDETERSIHDALCVVKRVLEW